MSVQDTGQARASAVVERSEQVWAQSKVEDVVLALRLPSLDAIKADCITASSSEKAAVAKRFLHKRGSKPPPRSFSEICRSLLVVEN